MVKLIVQMDGVPDRIMELASGPCRIGRSPENDVVLSHPSISSQHCVLEVRKEGLMIRDLGSTNGTELDGQPVIEAYAQSGQVISIGVVNCRVEGVAPQVSIPKWEAPPLPQLPPGVKPCVNHPEFPASMKCTHCHQVFCGSCIHLMRVINGKLHKFCPICSHECVSIEGMNEAETEGKLVGLLKKMIPKGATRRLHGKRRPGRRRKAP